MSSLRERLSAVSLSRRSATRSESARSPALEWPSYIDDFGHNVTVGKSTFSIGKDADSRMSTVGFHAPNKTVHSQQSIKAIFPPFFLVN